MSPPNSHRGLSILLIDDDSAVLTAVGDYLSTREHRVFPAEEGAEGLEILRREEIDIVITDIRMPGTGGFEVLREVRKTSPGTEVIMVTGYGDIDGYSLQRWLDHAEGDAV